MKKMLSILLIGCTLWLFACVDNSPPTPDSDPDSDFNFEGFPPYDATNPASFRAEITDLGEDFLEIQSPNLGLIHIEINHPVFLEGEQLADYDFTIGEQVEILFDGIIRETHPASLGEIYQINLIFE